MCSLQQDLSAVCLPLINVIGVFAEDLKNSTCYAVSFLCCGMTWITEAFLCLQDARQKFRSVLVEATVKLDELVKKIGKAVDESKPYWEARRLARQVSQQFLEGKGNRF